MELKTTEEFVREAHGAACSTWKQRIEKEFPDLFKTVLEVGKWYWLKTIFGKLLFCYKGGFGNDSGYGFDINGNWSNEGIGVHQVDVSSCTPATHEEVESALIAEAKKKGHKAGVRIKGLGNGKICTLPNGEFEYIKNANALWFGNPNDAFEGFDVFLDGIWADILPEEKTIITHEKALKILAKKLKVSPESIEIK